MDDQLTAINNALTKLSVSSSSPNDTIDLLNQISAAEQSVVQQLRLNEHFLQLLASPATSIATKTHVAKCTAEITKTEEQRRLFTELTIVKALVAELTNDGAPGGPARIELVIQVCRALGNILYQNDDARDILVSLDADVALINLLDWTPAKSDAAVSDDQVQQFLTVRCGLISNYLVGGEPVAKRAMEHGIMAKIERIVGESAGDVVLHEEVVLNVLPPLTILTETVPDLNFAAPLNQSLVRILADSKHPYIAEMCLDLLHYQAENDDVKLLLAKEGLCETIYRLLEQYKTQATTTEARALMKLACEIVVLILTGDESMHYLYKTPLIKYIEDWLDSDDVDLLTTGVLALGNFARTDSHCIYMVENKVMNKLLAILSKNNGIDDDMRLQHALLSTLRNLVIPKPNKPAIVEAGLVQTILPMLQIHQPPVVFKLLGTLRMTVDGQVKLAVELLQNEALIKQLVHWSKSSEFASVTGESLRLMAWLIKHAYFQTRQAADSAAEPAVPTDASSLRSFVQTEGAVECMVNMLTSQHLVMQNEALIALSILSSVVGSQTNESDTAGKSTLDALLVQCQLGLKLNEMIGKCADTMTKEIVENLQTFVALLRKSSVLVAQLDQHNVDEALKSIPILTEYCTL